MAFLQNKNHKLITSNGGFRTLKSYQKAEIIYDGTIYFTRRVFKQYDRTIDQMVQAARSGKQNIAEASIASATSKMIELNLTNIARASLEELKIDYEDFIRTNNLQRWDKQHPNYKRLSELNKIPNATYATFKKGIEHNDIEIAANVLHGLICVCSFLLKQHLKRLEQDLITQDNIKQKLNKLRKTIK